MGVQKVQQMALQFKSDWIISSFVPKVNECFNQDKQSFNYRMACLMSLSAVMGALQKDQISEIIVPTLIKAC